MKLLRCLYTLFFLTFFFLITQEAFSFGLPKTLSAVRHDVDQGYDFVKWSLGPGKTDPMKDLSQASTFFQLAIANAQYDFEEGIINEDYPELTLRELKDLVIQDALEEGRSYALTKSHRNRPPQFMNLNIVYLMTPGAILETPLGKRGLSNTTGECGYDTALQILRMELLPLASISENGNKVSFPNYPALNQNIAHLPYLKRFLLNKITTDEEARALRLEMAQFVDWRLLERPWNPMSNLSYGEVGCALNAGMSPTNVVRAWSYLLYLPPVIKEEVASSAKTCPQTGEKYKYAAHIHSLTIPFLTVPISSLGVEISFGSTKMQEVIEEDLKQRGQKLIGSLPPVMVYDLQPNVLGFIPLYDQKHKTLSFSTYKHQHYDSDLLIAKLFSSVSQSILNPIELRLPSYDQASSETATTLTPSIIAPIILAQPQGNVGGHVYALIQEQGNWYEINNEAVFPIPQKWEKDIALYLSRYPTGVNITYTTSEGSADSPFLEAPIEAPSLSEALELHRKMVAISDFAPGQIDFFLNYTFYWWAFYKEHPDLRKKLDLQLDATKKRATAREKGAAKKPASS